MIKVRVVVMRQQYIVAVSLLFLAVGLISENASAMPAGVPSFTPAQAWQVRSTTMNLGRELRGIKMPCIAETTYDNGYNIRFSGGGQRIMAMAVDFRQNAFGQGRKYNARLILESGPAYNVTATAFSPSVLIFNLREASGLYGHLTRSPSFQLDVAGNIMMFATGSLGSAFIEMESCYGGKPFPLVTPVTLPSGPGAQEPPRPAVMPNAVGGRVSRWDEDLSKVPSIHQSGKPPRVNALSKTMTWQARAGEDIRSTLMRWGKQAGVAVEWQASQGGQLTSDINMTGTFESAVQYLMAENSVMMGMDANMQRSPDPFSPVPNVPHMAVASSLDRAPGSPTAPPRPLVEPKWIAGQGTTLKQVLSDWSEREGVELVWQASHNFIVNIPVRSEGTYNQALEEILSQYLSSGVRPAAQLNNDPVTGRRVLFIQSTRVL